MIPTVFVILTVLSSTLTLPITTQDDVTASIEGVPQIQEGISPPQQVQKAGVQSSFGVNTQAQINQAEKSTGHLSTPEQYTKVNSAQQVTQDEVPTNVFVSPQNAAVPTLENLPVKVEPAQTFYSENPVLLPIQPLSVFPASQADQVPQLVVVPAEFIPAGKIVIMAIDSFQQKNFQQDVSNVPGSQIPYQQVVQPVTYTQVSTQAVEPNQQPNYVTPVEEPKQGYSPVRVQPNFDSFVKEPTVPVTQAAHQSVAVNYNQTPVKPNSQVYSIVHNEQPVTAENTKKQGSTSYSSVQTQLVEPSVQQQQYHVQQSVEKQVPYQQSSVQNQEHFVKQTGFETVVKQVPNQQYSGVQTQNVETSYQQQQQQQDYNAQQAVKTQVSYQQANSITPVQNQPVVPSVYNAQSTVVEKTEKVGQYQEAHSSVHVQSVEPQQEQTQNVQQVVEKQVPYQQPVAFQTHSVKPVSHQQVFNAQPQTIRPVENQVQYQKENQFQNVGNFSEKIPENSEFKPNEQVLSVQPQQVTNYAGEHNPTVGNEASKVQQNVPVHTLTSVSQIQDYSFQPSVGSA